MHWNIRSVVLYRCLIIYRTCNSLCIPICVGFVVNQFVQTIFFSPNNSGFPCQHNVDRDSSVGIGTSCGLDGPEIESRWGRDFPYPSRPALGPTQLPIQWVPGLCSRGRAAGAWCLPHTPFFAEVKKRVELYLSFPSGPLWPVLWRTLPLPYLST
jgi:hypothetical protein